MPKTILTDIVVRNLAIPSSGQSTYWDEKLPGFGCRVSQGGQKTFVVMYGPREARRRKAVGKYPLRSLKEARDLARKLQAEIALGVVPETPKHSCSFDEALESFLDAAEQRLRPRTFNDYKRFLNRYFSFGKKRIAEISKQDIQQRLSKLRSVPSEQMHADTIVRIFFNWAYREELIEKNPTLRLQRLAKTPTRERVLSDVELKKVYVAASQFTWPFGSIVQLCILTGQRRSEIGMLSWEWINLDDRLITLPGEKVKNGRSHAFPIGDTTFDLLKRLPQVGEFVFPGRTQSNDIFNGWAKSKKDLDSTLSEVGHYTLHDLRRTYSTLHARIGTPIHITERLLNHASGSISGVAAIYNRHNYIEEMRHAIDAYESHLRGLCE